MDKRIVNFLQRELDVSQIHEEDDLFDLGMRSMQFYRLITYIENICNIRLQNSALKRKNFQSLSALSKFLDSELQTCR